MSELVTNAVGHGAGPIELTVRCAETRAVIAVTDGGPDYRSFRRRLQEPTRWPGAGYGCW